MQNVLTVLHYHALKEQSQQVAWWLSFSVKHVITLTGIVNLPAMLAILNKVINHKKHISYHYRCCLSLALASVRAN